MAAINGRVEIVQFLIEQHAHVNTCSSDGKSCLLAASVNGHTDVVRELLFAGADVNLQCNDGSSALSAASQNGHIYVVKLIIQCGAEVHKRNNEGATPLYCAAMKGHIEVVQFLMEQHADINACCNDGQSCLLAAALNGHTDVVRALVSAGADVNLQCSEGFSPLIMASCKGHIDIVKLLVCCGAEVEICHNERATPLHMAAKEGHTEIVQFLIEHHANVNACIIDGTTCLLEAAGRGHTAIVRALVSAGADVKLQKYNGCCPLTAACMEGHIDIVTVLLISGADIEMRDFSGRTALWTASAFGHIDIVDTLIACGADVNAVDYQLVSPLCPAAARGCIDIVNTLIKHGANTNGEEGYCQDLISFVAEWRDGEIVANVLQLLMNNSAHVGHEKVRINSTALMNAVRRCRLDVVKVLVENGADIHARNVDNLQATDIASYSGHVDIVRFLYHCLTRSNSSNVHDNSFSDTDIDCDCTTAVHCTTDLQRMRSLLENGADVEAENVDGLRPIHSAVRTGLVDLVELLIQHGANVNAADVYGNRPLHDAVCHGLTVVQLLVQHGAKLNVQNVDGKTPLHLAVEHQKLEVFKFFVNHGNAGIGLADVWCNTPLHYLTGGQLTYGGLEKVTRNDQHVLIRNAVGLTASLNGVLDCVNRKQEFSNARSLESQPYLCGEQLTPTLRYSMILKTKVYCRIETSLTKPQYIDCYGNTALHRAVGVYGRLKMYRINTDVRKTVAFLVKRGADINAQNDDGLTPLHVARGIEATEACLKHADDRSFTAVDKRGRNFWHLMVLSKTAQEFDWTSSIVHQNMSALHAMKSSDDLNRTPLHYACMERNVLFAKLFAQHFSDEDVNKRDRFGRTALQYAAMNRLDTVVELLKTRQADEVVKDNFKNSAIDYRYFLDVYKSNISLLRLANTSSFLARNFRSILFHIQQCFTNRIQNLESSEVELRKMLCDLRADNTTLYVLNTYLGCCFNYSEFVSADVAALKESISEKELLDKKSKIDSQPDVFAEIHRHVGKAMQHLAEQISVKDSRFACEIVPVGSAHEGTKIGCCCEFDYNFVLTELSRSCKVCYSPESPPGFVLLKASTPGYGEDLFNSSGLLNTTIVRFKFEIVMKQILSSLSFFEATGFEFFESAEDLIAQPGSTSTKLNIQIKLRCTKPVNGHDVLHDISVDVVPAIRIDDWWPDDMCREDLCQAGDCLIVFTQPHRKYPWIGWTEPHGFISFAQAESKLLRNCPHVIKAAYMVVKRMSQYFCQYEFFSSHVIKTALFWCLDEVGYRSESSSSDDNDQIDGDELLRWVQNILRRLLCFAAQDYVPSYFLPKCHQAVWLKERYLKQFHMHLYQHGLSTYTDLFSLNKQQSQDVLLKYFKSMFIFSHVMYWTVLSDNDELELFVPSTVNPLTEKDVCTTLLPGCKLAFKYGLRL